MATKKTIEINVDSKQAVKSLDDLGGSFEDVYGEIQPLSGKLGELEDRLYQMAEAGDTSSKEFQDLTTEVGKMKKVIIDVDMAVDGMSQTMAQNVGGALGGVTAGFELGAGAMGAFGAESEQVEEALLRVQSAMAIAQGVQGIREAIPAFKGMGKSAMRALKGIKLGVAATGIGLLVTAIAAVAMNWDKVSTALGISTKAQKAQNEVMKSALAGISDELMASEKLSKVLKDESVSRKDKVKAVKELQKQYPELLGNLDAENATTDEMNKALSLNTKLLKLNAQVKAIQAKQAEIYTQQLEAEVDAQTGANEGLVNSIQAWTFGIEAKDLGIAKSNETVKALDEEAAVYDEIQAGIEAEIKALEELGGVSVKTAARQVTTAREVAETKEKIADEYNQDLIDQYALEEELRRNKLDAEEKEELAISDKYDSLIEKAHGNAELEKEIVAQQTEELNALYQERADAQQAIQDEADLKAKEAKDAQDAQDEIDKQKKIDDAKELEDAKYELAAQGLTLVSDLANLFAGDNEKAAKKAFEINKVASIAQATIDTYRGAISAFAQTPGGVVIKSVAAGIATASGLAGVANIAKTKFTGGGGSASASSGSTPSLGDSRPANFNVVGNDGNNQLAESLGGQVTKAYVVSGDVTTAQSLERNKIETATL